MEKLLCNCHESASIRLDHLENLPPVIESCLTVHGSEILYTEVAMTCLLPGQISSPFLAPSKHSRSWWLFKQGQLWETSSESESQQVKFPQITCREGPKTSVFCFFFRQLFYKISPLNSLEGKKTFQCLGLCHRSEIVNFLQLFFVEKSARPILNFSDRLRCCTMNFGWNWNGSSNHGIITWV